MSTVKNPNKIITIVSNEDGSTWRSNLSRILYPLLSDAKTNILGLSLGVTATSLGYYVDVSDEVELIKESDITIGDPTGGDSAMGTPIADYLTGTSGGGDGIAGKAQNFVRTAYSALTTGTNLYNTYTGATNSDGSNKTFDNFNPWFINTPAWNPSKGTQGVNIDLTFNFAMGQYGLWNAKEEVYLPILNLIAPLFPQSLSNLTISGPYPTTYQMLASMVAGATGVFDDIKSAWGEGDTFLEKAGNVLSTIGDMLTSDSESNGVLGTAVDVVQNLATALSTLVLDTYTSYTYEIGIGETISYSKCLPCGGSAKFSNETDQYGFPISGSCTISFKSIVPLALTQKSNNDENAAVLKSLRFGGLF